MFNEISKCRICGNQNLETILDLNAQALTGVFPKAVNENIPLGPLCLVKCSEVDSNSCGLVQLKHSYNPNLLFGDNYGYRSSLNDSMATHLKNKVNKILSLIDIENNDFIIDIGSNDGTTLKYYPLGLGKLIGIDPLGNYLKDYYPPHIDLIPDFFNAKSITTHYPNIKAKIISSFSMFYDLEAPLEFVMQIKEILHPEGIWVFEQSYLPSMLKNNSYDTICHEHLEYYSLKQIQWMCNKANLKIIDVEFNDINGGSFSITVAHQSSTNHDTFPQLETLIHNEDGYLHSSNHPYESFAKRVSETKFSLRHFLEWGIRNNKKIYGLGASTKGNVILQYCEITKQELPFIGEINPDKYGAFTPGTKISIIPENELLKLDFDYLIVLPWHFKKHFSSNKKYSNIIEKLVFPLPMLSTIHGSLSYENKSSLKILDLVSD